MAFTTVNPQVVTPGTNAVITYGAAAAAGNMFLNYGNTSVRVKNGSGAGITVTVVSVADPYGRTGDQVIALAAGAECEIGHLVPALWNQTSGDVGYVHISFSAVASVTIAVVQHG